MVFKADKAGVRQVIQASIRVKPGKSRLVYDDVLLGYEAMYFGINVSTPHRNVLRLSLG